MVFGKIWPSSYMFCFFLSKQSKKEIFFDRNECFFDVKSEVLKKSKKSTFWKGVSPWFLSKNWPFSLSCFLSKERQKETFFDILDRKESWVSPWFCLRIDLFLIRFYLSKKGRQKHFLIFCLENKVFWTSKVKFSKSRKKSTICKGVSPWFFFEKSTFSSYFFFSKKRKKERFFDILDRKECFLDHKKKF